MIAIRVARWIWLIAASVVLAGLFTDSGAQTDGIVIRNEGRVIPYRRANTPAGPTDPASAVNVGDILNLHYYPGLKFYVAGNYASAKNEMDYVIARPHYIEKNPRRDQLLSIAYYVRGMIYSHHASGMGRYARALADFQEAVKLNVGNHLARLELAKMLTAAGQTDEAVSRLNELLEEKPPLPAGIADEARRELEKIKSGKAE